VLQGIVIDNQRFQFAQVLEHPAGAIDKLIVGKIEPTKTDC